LDSIGEEQRRRETKTELETGVSSAVVGRLGSFLAFRVSRRDRLITKTPLDFVV
jgi:hypothetical protein